MTTKKEDEKAAAEISSANPDPVVAINIPGVTPATAPDDSLPLREAEPKDAPPAPSPITGNAVQCPHAKSKCAFTERKWSGLPVWQCSACGFDTMDAQIASIRRPDVVKV